MCVCMCVCIICVCSQVCVCVCSQVRYSELSSARAMEAMTAVLSGLRGQSVTGVHRHTFFLPSLKGGG